MRTTKFVYDILRKVLRRNFFQIFSVWNGVVLVGHKPCLVEPTRRLEGQRLHFQVQAFLHRLQKCRAGNLSENYARYQRGRGLCRLKLASCKHIFFPFPHLWQNWTFNYLFLGRLADSLAILKGGCFLTVAQADSRGLRCSQSSFMMLPSVILFCRARIIFETCP